MYRKIKTAWRIASLWQNAVNSCANGQYDKSLDLLSDLEGLRVPQSKHILLDALNRYNIADYIGCDFKLRTLLAMLRNDPSVSADDELYLLVYIKHLYLHLGHQSSLHGPDFYFPSDISTKNVKPEFKKIFPLV